MPFEIRKREREGVTLLDLEGRLIVGEPAGKLREEILALSAAGQNRLVLNLQKVDFIDSTGLGALVICFTTIKKAGGALKLLNLAERGIELLVLTKLTSVFEMFDDEQHAVNSFFPGREIQRFDILSFVQKQQRED
ncbi:MAG: STAS domain-containing protein [Bryobacteraceae bacterium]|nr:STAS domain-containing protein [Bryobacteraceae bacterium]